MLAEEIAEADRDLSRLIGRTAPDLIAQHGVGPEIAGQLLITAGDNPDRLRSEASFAALCGASPLPASSGKTNRHRLNRGGDRAANSALHRVVIVRMKSHQPTRAYVTRRTHTRMGQHGERAPPALSEAGATGRVHFGDRSRPLDGSVVAGRWAADPAPLALKV